MAKFLYEAASKEGLIVKGEFEAMTKADVIAHLEAKQLIPISVMGGGLQKGVRSSLDAALFERITPIDKIVMVRNLGAAVKAGLSIIETLDIMIADTNKRVVKSVLISAKSNLENGQPLYKTFESYGKIFPIIFVGMIKAGEASGGLDNALEELANHLTREYELTKKVKSALTYPIILLCAAIGVVALLLIFVLPRLTQTFSSSGIELPLITRLLISFSGFITSNWAVDSMVAAFLVWFFLFFRKRPAGRRFFTSVIMRIPIAKELLKKVALVRFTRTLASLILSGTSMLEALQLSADSVSNEAYKGAISESIKKVRSGV
ncbi:MAG: type II secretion system F family protein, partial [Candidatus Colwellbacteria bacterium]|nr:type II secretion system F family protein [Candidatus Colwellbacteria bacterium]